MDHHPSAATTTTTNHPQTESQRLISIAVKLLHSRDLTGAREFALLSQESDSLSEDSDQILAITDVLLASEKRVDNNRHHLDWFSILQTDRRSEPDQLKKNYRRLALLLHPEKNRFPLSDNAFKLVTDAWAALSAPSRATATANFWTTCPYCYVLYEYPMVYKECSVRCQNCKRAFHAVAIASLPPLVPGKEAYYCCWGFFPLGFSAENGGGKGKMVDDNDNVEGADDDVTAINNNVTQNNPNNNNTGFPNWMPSMGNMSSGVRGVVDFSNGGGFGNAMPGAKKRGRPRKNPVGF